MIGCGIYIVNGIWDLTYEIARINYFKSKRYEENVPKCTLRSI